MAIINNLHLVSEGIYRSGIITSENFDGVLELGSKTVISMKMNYLDVETERRLCRKSKIEFLHLPINIIEYGDYTKQQFWRAHYAVCERNKP